MTNNIRNFHESLLHEMAKQVRSQFDRMIKNESYVRDLPLIKKQLDVLMEQNNMIHSYSKMSEVSMEEEIEKTKD